MKNLTITLDYELYGDGTGDVFQHMIWPTRNILQICNIYNIKTTIFFEVIEYIKLKEEWEAGNKMGYKRNPISAIENQIRKAAKDGHDIQLHIHPQWVNAYFEKNRWNVDLSNWRLGEFKVDKDYSIEDLLRDGKEAIEQIVCEAVRDYKCTALRAGGYNIMPSREVYKAMQNLHLKIDSSVYPGGYEVGELSQYDYREAVLDKDYWWAKPKDFSQASEKSDVMEIPVFALPQKRIRKFNLERIKSVIQNRNSAIGAVKSKTGHKTKVEKIKYFFQKEAFTWDFCLFSFGLHKSFFNYIENNLQGKRQNFVVIGHPKSFTSDRSFKKMIDYAQNKGYKFKTLVQLYEEFNK